MEEAEPAAFGATPPPGLRRERAPERGDVEEERRGTPSVLSPVQHGEVRGAVPL